MIAATLMLMAAAPVPASVRVAFDAARTTAVAVAGDADTGHAVTADDPVRVASVSKLVVALGVMRLVEAGTLDLDRDVSAYLGWRLRNPAFPGVPITLRHLLSHRSSLTDGVDYAVPLGTALESVVADPKAWDAVHAPGRWFRYTNLNFPVVASVMEAATAERFDRLMARIVFAPLAIDACFNWTTCSDASVARVVVLRDANRVVVRDDLDGRRPDCPVRTADEAAACDLATYRPGTNGALFSPQGGLRISANDLARIGQLLLGHGDKFLSRRSIAMLTTPAWRFDGTNGETEGGFYCSYGLGVQTLATRRPDCRDDPFGDGRRRIGHAGEAYGVRSGMWVDTKARTGVAYFATAVPDDATGGVSAFTQVEEALAGGKK